MKSIFDAVMDSKGKTVQIWLKGVAYIGFVVTITIFPVAKEKTKEKNFVMPRLLTLRQSDGVVRIDAFLIDAIKEYYAQDEQP